MKQKEIIKQAISLDHKPARLLFLTNWLEDINWHSENVLFTERNIDPETQKYLDDVQWLFIAMYPNDYSLGFVEQNREQLEPYIKAIINQKKHNRGSYSLPCGRTIGESSLYDLKQAYRSVSVVSRITGWGLSDGWRSTSGDSFVEELEQMLAEFEEKDEENERTRLAYLKAYSD